MQAANARLRPTAIAGRGAWRLCWRRHRCFPRARLAVNVEAAVRQETIATRYMRRCPPGSTIICSFGRQYMPFPTDPHESMRSHTADTKSSTLVSVRGPSRITFMPRSPPVSGSSVKCSESQTMRICRSIGMLVVAASGLAQFFCRRWAATLCCRPSALAQVDHRHRRPPLATVCRVARPCR